MVKTNCVVQRDMNRQSEMESERRRTSEQSEVKEMTDGRTIGEEEMSHGHVNNK